MKNKKHCHVCDKIAPIENCPFPPKANCDHPTPCTGACNYMRRTRDYSAEIDNITVRVEYKDGYKKEDTVVLKQSINTLAKAVDTALKSLRYDEL